MRAEHRDTRGEVVAVVPLCGGDGLALEAFQQYGVSVSGSGGSVHGRIRSRVVAAPHLGTAGAIVTLQRGTPPGQSAAGEAPTSRPVPSGSRASSANDPGRAAMKIGPGAARRMGVGAGEDATPDLVALIVEACDECVAEGRSDTAADATTEIRSAVARRRQSVPAIVRGRIDRRAPKEPSLRIDAADVHLLGSELQPAQPAAKVEVAIGCREDSGLRDDVGRREITLDGSEQGAGGRHTTNVGGLL
ncbi:MAG: hypothetical protein AAF726_23915 [Planctomycetota bacterium]